MTVLTEGMPSVCCVCGTRTVTWWRGGDFYAAVHDGCVARLVAACPVLTDRAAVAVQAPARRFGAYARRAGHVDRFVPSRFPAAHDAWLVLAEMNTGQLAVPCGGNVGHAVAVLRRYRLLTERGRPIMGLASAGAFAVGAALFTPEREVVASWGYVPVVGAPAWEPLRIVVAWSLCTGCGAYLWPGRWVTVAAARCVLCAHHDDRLWPVEPDFPGEKSMPDHMREDAGQRTVRRSMRTSRYADDHA